MKCSVCNAAAPDLGIICHHCVADKFWFQHSVLWGRYGSDCCCLACGFEAGPLNTDPRVGTGFSDVPTGKLRDVMCMGRAGTVPPLTFFADEAEAYSVRYIRNALFCDCY